MRKLSIIDRIRGYHVRGGVRALNCCGRSVLFGEAHTHGA